VLGKKPLRSGEKFSKQHTRLLATTKAVAGAQSEPTQNGPLWAESDPPFCPPKATLNRRRALSSNLFCRSQRGGVRLSLVHNYAEVIVPRGLCVRDC
jgi:hypothetical protein